MKKLLIPNTHSSIKDWTNYISKLHYKEIDLRLDRVYYFAKRLNLLKPAPITIVVGGTNGKGSTCRFLELMFIYSNIKVGVYSSPHLINYNERIRLHGNEVSDEECINAMNFINKIIKKTSISYFEFSTLVALLIFKSKKLDVVILEVGLGGRLDATNVVDIDISVVTNVSIDHTEFLGKNCSEIAKEKSGIFRYKKLSIFGGFNNLLNFKSASEYYKSIPYFLNVHWFYKKNKKYWMWSNKTNNIFLPYPILNIENAATALAVIKSLPFTIPYQSIFKGLKTATLPGRFQIINKKPFIILDVAHNPSSAKHLAKKIKRIKKNFSIIYAIIGMLSDKDIKNTLKYFIKIIDIWNCASLSEFPRGASCEEISIFLNKNKEKNNVKNFKNVISAFKYVINIATKKDCILIFGSFYTISYILKNKKNIYYKI
ncbi:folC [Wigglesworthia glossinidia endosymbiont of Glossina brevipalpis]|uniref:Dihydrofolate synthase/folylpolyglutamate synthase n=1 Tax=Wigglesworthia glossinidia brevipalpis TaxID=36870 RepID=Q8D2P3_WIGBR|nr:folC [Wigglesworthia glossinidia endosymbiont of Glossina brevipalpis]